VAADKIEINVASLALYREYKRSVRAVSHIFAVWAKDTLSLRRGGCGCCTRVTTTAAKTNDVNYEIIGMSTSFTMAMPQ
jgi:hypothetical protein